MNRPWQVWLLFVACVLGAAGAMAWLTQKATESDRMRRAAEAEAELEQRVSLAVWRMDTELAPIIAAEVIRPSAAFNPGVMPAELPPFVLLQFRILPSGMWQSPQSPMPKSPLAPRLQELTGTVSYQQLLSELPSTPLPSAADVARNQINGSNVDLPQVANTAPNGDAQGENPFQFFEGNRGGNNLPNAPAQIPQQAANAQPAPQQQQAQAQPQQIAKENDFQQRNKRYQTAAQQGLFNTSQNEVPQNDRNDVSKPGVKGSMKGLRVEPAEQVGVSRPLWVGNRLLLARRVTNGGATVVQGSWLDWPQLKARLLGEAADLLPNADLVPVNGDQADDPSRMLAGLPVRLIVNESSVGASVGPTLRWALWMGWGAVLVAVLAAAALLHGVMSLSERRAAFVSSVTHELRTPLTTFRMYAEMLAKGMVPDAARRQEYFETLQRESERLTLLVENVLAYARLERGRKPQAQDQVTLAGLLSRIGPRLKQRAAQAGMQCDVQVDNTAADQPFTTDQAVVEQILFNLVDNAAKYARDAEDRRIHVEASRNGQCMRLSVRDHGPGINGGLWTRHTQPFSKSAQESAESAPGVGLGLALCRRLARQLGGRLEMGTTNGDGAEVRLLLPVD